MLLFECLEAEIPAIKIDLEKSGLMKDITIKHDVIDKEGNPVDVMVSVYLNIPFDSYQSLQIALDNNDSSAHEILKKLKSYTDYHDEAFKTYILELKESGYDIPKCYENRVYFGISESELRVICDPRNMGFLLLNFEPKYMQEIKESLRLSGLTELARFEEKAYDMQKNLIPDHNALYIVGVPYLTQYEVGQAAKRGDERAKELNDKVDLFFKVRFQLYDVFYDTLLRHGYNIPIENKYKLYAGMSKMELLSLCK